MGRRHTRRPNRRLPRQPVARYGGQPHERCREDDRTDPTTQLWDARTRNHDRRSQSVHAHVDRQHDPDNHARYGIDRRVLPRERKIIRADASSPAETVSRITSYFATSRTPRYSMLFALPLLIVYEGLAALLGDGDRGT